jgi:general secretion pathway protein G
MKTAAQTERGAKVTSPIISMNAEGNMRKRVMQRIVDAERGMTLIEIMIVVAIIGLIMSGVTVVAVQQWRKAQVKDAARTVKTITGAIELYETSNQTPCPANLDELVQQKLLSKHPKDPWGEELIYRCPGEQTRDSADVASKGPDRKEGTDDDIKSWEL